MPRTLPWLKDKPPSSSKPSPSSATSRQPSSTGIQGVKRRRLDFETTTPSFALSNDKDDDDNNDHEDNDDDEELHGPSSSPPNASSATQPPPPPSPFREGEDDVWIMVEDEFNTTAQLFTSHLHRAEYKRLKRKAAERSQSSLNERMTDGQTPRNILSTFKEAQANQRHKTKRAVKELGGVSDAESEDVEVVGDEEIAIPDWNLASLMIRPGGTKVKSRTKLESLVGRPVTSNTRAAAGFGKQRQDTSKIGAGGIGIGKAKLEYGVGRVEEKLSKWDLEKGETKDEIIGDARLTSKNGERLLNGPFGIGKRAEDKLKGKIAPDDFPFARSSLVQRKMRLPIKREKDADEEDDGAAEVPTFLY